MLKCVHINKYTQHKYMCYRGAYIGVYTDVHISTYMYIFTCKYMHIYIYLYA